MEPFTKTINGIEFRIQGILEGQDEVCRISVDSTHFKMIVDNNDNWHIPHQVPLWIKKLEKELGEAINETYC